MEPFVNLRNISTEESNDAQILKFWGCLDFGTKIAGKRQIQVFLSREPTSLAGYVVGKVVFIDDL